MYLIILNFFYFLTFSIFFFQIGSFLSSKIKNSKIDHYKSLNFFFGVFLVGNIIVILNFILPTSSYLTYIVLLLLFILSCTISINYKYICKIILINLIIYPVCLKMVFEYDSGLYHLPYQNILRNEKIIFGLANLSRFGFSSFQEYITSVIWSHNFIFHKFFLGSFLSFFFLFLDDLRKTRLNLDNLYFYFSLLTLPFISRYFTIYATGTDLTTGILLVLQFYFFIKIFLIYNFKKKIDISDLQILIILTFLSVTFKGSSILSLILFFLIIFFSIKSFKFLKLIIFKNIFVLFLIFVWILKNIIISGCIIYPISFSCLNFLDWNAMSQAKQDSLAVTTWNRQPYVGHEDTLLSYNWLFNYWFKTYLPFILSTLFLLFYILIINFIFFYFKNKKLYDFFYFFFIFSTIFLFQDENFLYINKLLNFYLYSIIITFSSIFFFIIIKNYYKTIIVNINQNLKFFLIFNFYFFLCIFLWFYKFPNPRFGFGYFYCLFIYFGFLTHIIFNHNRIIFNFFGDFRFKNSFILYLLIIVIFSQTSSTASRYSIYNFFNNSFWTTELNTKYFERYDFPLVAMEKREHFGFKPLKTDQCWINLYCYADAEDVRETYLWFNYKKLKRY